VAVLAQPLAINDLLQYLIAACDLSGRENQIFEIGGPDRVSYGDLMREYARPRGLRRLVIRVPLLTPRLCSLWLGLVTPLYARIGRKLIDSIRNPTVVCDVSAMKAFTICSRSDCQRVAQRGKRTGGDALVGCPVVGRRITAMGRDAIWQPAD
jgi:hypothetical protein